MDELEQLLAGSGGYDPVADFDSYLAEILGGPAVNRQNYPPMGHSASGMMGRGSARDGITHPGQIPMDENGYVTGRAATFATQSDLNNYARTKSLATGDNGIGAWGANTATTPGVAIPRDWLRAQYGSEDAGKNKLVEVISPNGKSAILPVLDKGPALRNRSNSALIELTGPATQVLGSGDMGGYKFKFL